MKWYKFDKSKGYRQKRPPEKKYVLVITESRGHGLPEGIAIGWMKNAAGDKNDPYFIVPGRLAIGAKKETPEVIAWCDCLPDDFEWPPREFRPSGW